MWQGRLVIQFARSQATDLIHDLISTGWFDPQSYAVSVQDIKRGSLDSSLKRPILLPLDTFNPGRASLQTLLESGMSMQ
jgi:hypothetical protein